MVVYMWTDLIVLKLLAQRCICVIVSVAIAVVPVHAAWISAGALAFLAAPMWAVAQTTPPPGAADGQALGQSLLKPPASDGSHVYFQGSNGVESISTSDLFQPGGSQNDVQ